MTMVELFWPAKGVEETIHWPSGEMIGELMADSEIAFRTWPEAN